jgi:hypothetical protein
MAEEISKEATHKLQAADNEHINLETIAIIIKRILYGIIEAIITHLCKAEDNQWQEVLHLSKSMLDLFRLLLLLLWLAFNSQVGQGWLTIEGCDLIQTIKTLIISLLRIKKFGRLDDKACHQQQNKQRDNEDEETNLQPILNISNDGEQHDFTQSPFLMNKYQNE